MKIYTNADDLPKDIVEYIKAGLLWSGLLSLMRTPIKS